MFQLSAVESLCKPPYAAESKLAMEAQTLLHSRTNTDMVFEIISVQGRRHCPFITLSSPWTNGPTTVLSLQCLNIRVKVTIKSLDYTSSDKDTVDHSSQDICIFLFYVHYYLKEV